METQVKEETFLKHMADFIFTSKYARYLEKEKRRETWEEAVERVRDMHLRVFSWLPEEKKEEIKWAFEKVKEKRAVPSMRSLQFGGQAIEVKNQRIYNCSVIHIHSIRSFAESFHLLLCGTGVGFGLNKKFLSRLPDLVGPEDKTGIVLTYVVQDTIEGWADSLEALLMCYFKNTPYTGRKIVFDFSRIRKKGTLLKTSGGKAPGHHGLKQSLERIKKQLDHMIEVEKKSRMSTVDAYDILMHASDAVLSGGIRRAATSVVFEKDDEDMMLSKTEFQAEAVTGFLLNEKTNKYNGTVIHKGQKYDVELSQYVYDRFKSTNMLSWHVLFPWRARSNNSVLFLRNQFTREDLKKNIEATKQWGEPGFVFANHEDTLYNPCLTSETLILLGDGTVARIGDLARENFKGQVIATKDNGESVVGQCSRVWKTRENADIVKITFRNGFSFRCTPDHPIVSSSGFLIKASELQQGDAVRGLSQTRLIVESVESIPKKEDVYDMTVDFYHNFVVVDKRSLENGSTTTIGAVVGNCYEIGFIPALDDGRTGVQFCNLTSVNGAMVKSMSDFLEATKAATIVGTLQAAYTNFQYLSNEAKMLTEEEALLGVSITGLMDNPEVLLDEANQIQAAKLAVAVNEEWAKTLFIKPAARITCVKPEGCLVKETLIATEKGILYLDEIGDISGQQWQDHDIKVLGENGWKKSPKFFVNGFKETRKLTTQGGVSIERTLNHKLRVLDVEKKQVVWKEIKDINIDDEILYRVGGYNSTSEYQKLKTIDYEKSKFCTRLKPIIQPEVLDEELGWALGFIYGDGSVHKSGLRISGDVRKQEDLIKVANIMKTKFNISHLVQDYTKKRDNDNRCQYYFNSRELLAFLRENEILKPKSGEMKIPKLIRKSPASVLKSFIDGYMQADGHGFYEDDSEIKNRSIVTISKKMAQEIVVVSRLLGIDAKMRVIKPTETSLGINDRYWISFRKGKDSDWSKQTKERTQIWNILKELQLEDFYTEKVKLIESSEQYTYDIEVEDVHNYCANSIVSHNTSSIVLQSASGIHPHHAKRYFRRIQCNKKDNVYKYFKKINPHMCEESIWSATKSDDSIVFPVTVPENAMVKNDLTALKHLEIVKKTQQNWVIPGTTKHNKKDVTHNVSVTIEVNEDEWEQVIDYLFENKQYFAAVSMIPKTGDKLYKQPPMERVLEEDEERWNELVSKFKEVDYTKLKEEEDQTELAQQIACGGGKCEIDFSKPDE